PTLDVVNSVAFSPDGKTLADGDDTGNVQLWDVATKQQTSAIPSPDGLSGAAAVFSPDGRTLVIGSFDGRVRFWHVATRQQVGGPLTSHNGGTSMAISRDGKTLAGGFGDGRIRLWDVATPPPVAGRPPLRSRARATAWAFSADATAWAAGNRNGSADNNGRAVLWDVAPRRPIGGPLISQDGWLTSVAFSPDGKTLVGGFGDGWVRL